MNSPRVSVIIPTRNSEKYIEEALDSILNQTFWDFEILIVDDNSSDETISIIGKYEDPRIKILSGPNKGLAAALNFAVREAEGEFIARMDADDISDPSRLGKQVTFLDENPDVGVCGTQFKEFMDGDAIHDHMENVRYIDIIRGCYIGHPTAMFRRKLFADLNLWYNEEMRFSEDYDLWSRAIRVTKLANIPEVLLHYRRHNDGASIAHLAEMHRLDVGVKLRMIEYLLGGLSRSNSVDVTKLLKGESVEETVRVPLLQKFMASIKHADLCSPLEFLSFFHQIKPFQKNDLIFLTESVVNTIPIFVISYNHLTHVNAIVSFLEKAGLKNIEIIDNASSYPPLIEYLKHSPHKIHHMGSNYKHMVLFDSHRFDNVIDTNYFVLTDPDVIPSEGCPFDFLYAFLDVLLAHPTKNKVGFSLKIDDLPDHYELKDNVIKWEGRFYDKPFKCGDTLVYDAPIDTTFALYRPRSEWRTSDFYAAFRSGHPYTARHLPWYRNLSELTDEELYYRHTDAGSSNWNGTMASDELHRKYGTGEAPPEATRSRRRLCLFAGYGPGRPIDDYVVRYIEALSKLCDVYYLAAHDADEADLQRLVPITRGCWARAHDKYDFGSWQELIFRLGWHEVEKYDSLILANDSNYGPLRPLDGLFEKMEATEFDAWGITENYGEDRHLQSYFLVLNSRVINSEALRNFFYSITSEKSKKDICIKYEIGLSRLLASNGFSFGTYVSREGLHVPATDDIATYQNTLVKAGSPFLKRKVFIEPGFAHEDIEETRELLRELGYPLEWIPTEIPMSTMAPELTGAQQEQSAAHQERVSAQYEQAGARQGDGADPRRNGVSALIKRLLHPFYRPFKVRIVENLFRINHYVVNLDHKINNLDDTARRIEYRLGEQTERLQAMEATVGDILNGFGIVQDQLSVLAQDAKQGLSGFGIVQDQLSVLAQDAKESERKLLSISESGNDIQNRLLRLSENAEGSGARLADLEVLHRDTKAQLLSLSQSAGDSNVRLVDLQTSAKELHGHLDWVQRDILIGLMSQIDFASSKGFACLTEYPVAYDSPDHIHPVGTVMDHTRHPRFIRACEDFFGRGKQLSFLDVGCSAGGIVLDAILRGHIGIGLEGSDISRLQQRAEWRLLEDSLFTCDITRPFELRRAGDSPFKFDVISAWEVVEHLTAEGVEGMFDNLARHTHSGSLFVCSISQVGGGFTDDGVPLHQTIQPLPWWRARAARYGFDILEGDAFSRLDFARGNGNPSIYYRPASSYVEKEGDCLLVAFRRR